MLTKQPLLKIQLLQVSSSVYNGILIVIHIFIIIKDLWAPYPNLAQAMKNPAELEKLIQEILNEKSNSFADSLSQLIKEATSSSSAN